MKAEDYSNLSVQELTVKAKEIEEQLFRLRFQLGMGQADGLKNYRMYRKNRARLLTAMRAKELAAGKGN
ncbi:MAG: 50S ribosomal protein L29 [Bryobacterales bacterium]|jgi:large subunit ribosomal protein L29|nr:50S ribosomal protein L29 [Bryobacterales bacterium]